jgi:peptide/nickel transport system ATP-binding protein
MSRSEIHENVIAAFARVGFPDPERAFKSYPFELSGGMRQRAMIAMAIIGQPQVLIADEPTTALDVTTQATVLGLLRTLQRETGMAMILVTHDLGVVANMADDVVVMERGRVVEAAPLRLVLGDPRHSYTRRLIAAAPMIPEDPAPRKEAVAPDVLLEMRNISKTFTMRAARPWSTPVLVRAVQDFNLDVPRNTTVAIVGESGSGKTTCARIALGAMPADDGAFIRYNSKKCAPIDVHDLTPSTRKPFQLLAQMVFQDPYSTLNPRMRVRETLFEPMEIHRKGTRAEREARAEELLVQVGLSPVMLGRYPHAFSGGQRQRLSIARALMMGPEFLVCDEPTSALDVSVQEQVLALLEELQEQMGLSYLFISHDLAVVARIADEVAVMRRGLVVEQGPPDLLFCNPTHPYTRALIAAQPEPDVNRPIDLDAVSRGAGDPSQWPEAFRFEAGDVPPLRSVEDNHMVRQHG